MNIDTLSEEITSSDVVNLVHRATTVQEKMNAFNGTIVAILDKLVPLKTKELTIRPCTRWFNSHIVELRKERRKAELVWRKSKLESHKKLYVTAKNKVNKAIMNAKRTFVRNSINENKNNPKKTV